MLTLVNCWSRIGRKVPRIKNDVEIEEIKMLNRFCNDTSYHPELKRSHFEEWVNKNINIDFKRQIKVLHIGTVYQEFLTMYSEMVKANIEVIDHSILRIHQIQKKLKSLGSRISARQMDYTKLEYVNHQFDYVISEIVFQFQSIEKQIQSLQEVNRVLNTNGNHYVLLNEQGIISGFYEIMKEFNHNIKINKCSKENLSNISECLENLYDNIEVEKYETEYFIYDVTQFMNLSLIYNDSNYINEVVKKHLGKQFHEFIELKIKKQGPIVLKQKYKLYKCSEKKKTLKVV